MSVMLGARWEDPIQDERISEGHQAGLIDYAEVNYPIPYGSDPHALDIPILAHTSSNPTCSVHGINKAVARFVRDGANRANSPWIGEHLTWLGAAEIGSLGYQINPLFTPDFRHVAVSNLRRLRDYYDRAIALELGPIYTKATGYDSELHFLADVANEIDAMVILDVTHWQIANRNLDRPPAYGIDILPKERIVELHVAGMRKGSDGFWHDSHRDRPNEDVLEWTQRLVAELTNLRAVTFEHDPDAPGEDFFDTLGQLDKILLDRRRG